MAEPVNYLAMMPQIDLGQSLMRGFQMGAGIRNMQAQQEMMQAKELEAQSSMARQAQLDDARQRVIFSNAPQAIKEWAGLDPKNASEYIKSIGEMDENQRTSEFNAAAPVLQALKSGESGIALKLIRQRADALRNSGQNDEADQMDIIHQLVFNKPEQATQQIEFLMNSLDPDRFEKMNKNIQGAQPNIEKANQNYVKLFGRNAYSLIQQGKPTEAIALLEAKIQEGNQKGYNTDALEAMRMEATSRYDGSPDSIGLVLSGIDEKLGEDLKNIGEIAFKKAQTQEVAQRADIAKQLGMKQAQAELEASRAQTARAQAETAATEQKRLLDAEFQPRIQAAELAKTQAETAAKDQAMQIEAKYTPVLKQLEINAANAKAAADAKQAAIDDKYKEPMAALQLQLQQAAAAKAQRDNAIESKYADQVAQAKMTQEEANARIAQEKAANAQVYESAQAQIADADARIKSEKAEVARPAEQAALQLSQASAQVEQEKAAVARQVEQANAEVSRLNAEKLARENAIGQEFDRAKAAATAQEAAAKAQSAEAAAKFAAQTEEINFKEKERAHEQAKKEQKSKLEQLAANLGLTRAQTTEAMVRGKKLGTENQKILMELQAAKNNPGGLKAEDKFKAERELRDEHLKRSKQFREVRVQFDKLKASAAHKSGQGDIGLVVGFMKMLEPDSVVRETEFATAEASSGRLDQLYNMLKKFSTGERMTDENRAKFVDLADKYYQSFLKYEKQDQEIIRNNIKHYGLEEKNILTAPAEVTAKPSGAIKGMPKGFKIIGKE